MHAGTVINQVFILFIIIIVGYIAAKFNIITKEASKKLSELLLNITVPAMVIVSFQFEFSKDTLFKGMLFLGVCFIIVAILILLSTVIFKRVTGPRKPVLLFASVFCNSAFMGFPVLKSLFGSEGIFYGSMFVICFNVFCYTYGVMIYTGKKNLSTIKEAVFNPGIISVAVGMLLFVFSIKLPGPIYTAFDMIGSITVPVSMMVIGSLIAETKILSLFSQVSLYFTSFIRLVFYPMLVLVALHFTSFPTHLRDMMVVVVSMPAAANTAIFSEMYDGDSLYASQIVAITTILSMATIPVMLIFTKIL